MGSRGMRKWPESSVFDSRVAPVACSVASTVAPEITDPVLSVTVPEKLPLDWPYRSGQMGNTTKLKAPSRAFLLNIDFSFRWPYEWRADSRFPTKVWRFPSAMRTI